MKILLVAVNAKYIHSNLAVYSLKANCGRYESQVKLMEYSINQYPEEILRAVYRRYTGRSLQGESGYGRFFLLYMEYSDHRTGCPVAEDGVAGNPDMAWRSGSIL